MPPKKSNNSKKKKAAGPVRGYGTVSVPKKKDPIVEEPELAPEDQATDGGAGVNGEKEEGNGGKEGEEKKGTEGGKEEGSWDDPEEVEKRELQNLAERIRPGCDKEINRIVKVRVSV